MPILNQNIFCLILLPSFILDSSNFSNTKQEKADLISELDEKQILVWESVSEDLHGLDVVSGDTKTPLFIYFFWPFLSDLH